ncbi:MAG: cobalt ECF transporter T component CbiQ [Jaaginema sp. PMC 1079.18]|nr:cobalt ECF transporter T component CbiQ [Jaaginema sp. PMC 1080.18]MEC4849377.1 cobalt ECF transporter T component CbiQ [Jaaginema sp. PMC 1079.18]MEC4865410.1 cobalt ECF transporter T component CbiQ [Jaaginema sp. PMC 1078.18]
MHHQIDSLAYTNHLRSLPPSHKVGFAIALFMLGFVSWMGVQGAIAIWLAIWIICYAGIPAKIYGQLLLIPLTFWLLSVPALILGISFSGNVNTADIAWGSRYFYLSQQGISQVQIILMRAIALSSCLYFILLTTPFADILNLLKVWRFPTIIIELLALMYRFIFVLTDTVLELITAQKSRLGYHNRRSQLRSLGIIVSQLLWRTLENYRACSLGLISRGFNGELRFWSDREYQANSRYLKEALVGYGLLLLLAIFPYIERNI